MFIESLENKELDDQHHGGFLCCLGEAAYV